LAKLPAEKERQLPSAWRGVAEIIAGFLAERSERTRRAYETDLEDFRSFLGVASRGAALEELLRAGAGAAFQVVTRYKAALRERGLSPATLNRRLASLRSLVKFARAAGLVNWNLGVQNVKGEGYRDTRGPGRAGVQALLDELGARGDEKAVRDRAIIRLLYDLGLRRGEVVSLDAEDVDAEAGTVKVVGKGRAEKQILTLPEPTKRALAAWFAVRGDSPGPLFTNFDPARKGGRLTGTAVYYIVKKLGDKAGVKARPHGLRHAAITEALDKARGDVRAVQKFSRHRDLRTLTVYDDSRRDYGGEVARRVAATVE